MLRKIEFIILIVVLMGCSNKPKSESFTFLALDTACTITIYDGTNIDIEHVKELIKNIENKMSAHKDGSDIININNSNGEKVSIDNQTLEVIKRGLFFGNLSNGIFDISIGPLVTLWNVGESSEPPKDEDIDKLLPLIEYKNIDVDSDGSVSLLNPNMKLDLGGIAKGYAADVVKNYLVSEGVTSAIINLGGNINLIGKKIDNSDWNIGIQHPREERGKYVGILSINDTSLVSSGDYERYFIADGVRYHHILNSETGYPVRGEFIGSSIVYPKSIDSDALSTITFSSSIEEIISLKEKIPFSGIFVTEDKRIYISKDIEDNFRLVDDSYRLITF